MLELSTYYYSGLSGNLVYRTVSARSIFLTQDEVIDSVNVLLCPHLSSTTRLTAGRASQTVYIWTACF